MPARSLPEQVYIDMLVNMVKKDGLKKAAEVIVYDRHLCDIFEIKYSAKDVYSQAEKKIKFYVGLAERPHA